MNPEIKIEMIEVSRYLRVKALKAGNKTTVNMLQTCYIRADRLAVLNQGQEIYFKADKKGAHVCALAWEDKRYNFIGSGEVNGCVVGQYLPKNTTLL